MAALMTKIILWRYVNRAIAESHRQQKICKRGRAGKIARAGAFGNRAGVARKKIGI